MNKSRFKKTSSTDAAILVLSCDKYSDLWKPFFSLLSHMWPDCPFPMYLGSNTKRVNDQRVTTITSGKAVDWSTDTIAILRKMKEEYVFVWVDDFFPIQAIDTQLFQKVFGFMRSKKANHIHMSPDILPDHKSSDSLFGQYEAGAPYRVTLGGFWNRAHLLELLLPGEDPWNFEIMGSYRARYFGGYYGMNVPLFELIRVVEKGIIHRKAFSYCRNHGIILDTRKRRVQTFLEELRSDLTAVFFQLVLRVSWRRRVSYMELVRRIFVSY